MVSSCFLAVALITSALSSLAPPTNLMKWSESAEAVFLTKAELKTWKGLRDDESRARFIDQYWARRDPQPQTPVNEFRERVRMRILEADRQFALRNRVGSETARGHVYVLLGPPATVTRTVGPLDQAPRMGAFGIVEQGRARSGRRGATTVPP